MKINLERYKEVKDFLVANMTPVITGSGTRKVTIANSHLTSLMVGEFSSEILDSMIKDALTEMGFEYGEDFESELNPTTKRVVYSQQVNDRSVSPEKLFKLICEEYEISTDMGKLALKEALKNLTLFDRKQRDYGSGNISDFGEMGVLIRLNDKINRLKNLLNTQTSINFESLSDTWDDIANYGLIGKLCNLKLWK